VYQIAINDIIVKIFYGIMTVPMFALKKNYIINLCSQISNILYQNYLKNLI